MRTLATLAIGVVLSCSATAFAGDGEPCTGDLNADGGVNVLDLIVVFQNFGCQEGCSEGDANGDGRVNVMDVVTVAMNFGPCDGAGCQSASDCDDGDDCTLDFCVGGTCFHLQLPNCDAP